MARKKLGEMLLDAGVIDEHKLRAALADQRRWGRSLGKTLVDMGFVAEEDLVRVLGEQLGLAAVDLDPLNIPPSIIQQVPAEIARQHHLIPFEQRMKFLHVAMVDPTNMGVVDELRIRTQLNIHPYLAGPRQVERALLRYYGIAMGRRQDTMIPFEQPDSLPLEEPLAAAAPPRRPSRPTQAGIGSGVAGIGEPRPVPYTPPAAVSVNLRSGGSRDAEIDALQERISTLESLVERDEAVLRKLLALLIDKGIATRDEILERLG